MIYKLRKKFILISAISVIAVIITVFSLMTIFNVISMNKTFEVLADNIYNGGGAFADFAGDAPPNGDAQNKPPNPDIINPETRFSTRYFTVWLDGSGEVTNTNTTAIYAVTEETAVEYAKKVYKGNGNNGWLINYHYKVFDLSDGKMVVFIDGSQKLSFLLQTLTILAVVLVGCAALVLLLIFILSKKVVKPFADNYEKQKLFVTDANHELKTPLTLILANIDIAENELGKNEWLDDVRDEGERMTELVNQLVELSRADEDSRKPELSSLSLSDIVKDTLSDFNVLAVSKNKQLDYNIDSNITYVGDEAQIRRLLAILLDNAVKYCDDNGEISVSLYRKRGLTLTVENTYCDVDKIELNKLFDRFYRADSARPVGGFGVGLSIAKAITKKHNGEISAYKKDKNTIGFRVVLK